MFKATLIAGLLATVAAFFFGMRVESWRVGAQAVKQVVKVVHVVEKQAAVTTQVATQVQAGQDRVHYVTKEILKEVPVAIPPAADPVLPYGWLRLHNAAAFGVSPSAAPPGEPDDAPSGVVSSAALVTVVGNYDTSNTCFVALKGWQDWARGVGLTPSPPGSDSH